MNDLRFANGKKSFFLARKIKKTLWKMLLVIGFLFSVTEFVYAAELDLETPSYILMEASTGTVIEEKNADERLSPASITKLMTMYLIFQKLDQGKIQRDDLVTTSSYAKSMGGSQVFLEEGEVQTVDTLIKCIAVASGNDASVAMAEYIAGSETGFVELMNTQAERMGLSNTHYMDCCGLSDSDEHYTSARDVAVLSRALITDYPEVLDYTGIWMEDMVHKTRNGESVFTLSSTNKLLKMYDWTTGLKTGSTAKAKYCISATARKDDMDLIAVIMAAPNNKRRFQDAVTLLGYGFNVSEMYEDKEQLPLPELTVKGGTESSVPLCYQQIFRYLDTEGNDLSQIEKELRIQETLEAPVEEGTPVGELLYTLHGERIGSCSVLTTKTIEKMTFSKSFYRLLQQYFLTESKYDKTKTFSMCNMYKNNNYFM